MLKPDTDIYFVAIKYLNIIHFNICGGLQYWMKSLTFSILFKNKIVLHLKYYRLEEIVNYFFNISLVKRKEFGSLFNTICLHICSWIKKNQYNVLNCFMFVCIS